MSKRKTKKNKAAAKLGRLGGEKILRTRGKEYMSELGQKSAESRWGYKRGTKKKVKKETKV